jgi:hypothetical protein
MIYPYTIFHMSSFNGSLVIAIKWKDNYRFCVAVTSLFIVNVKLSMCFIKHHTMKMYRGVEVQLHTFLTSALDGAEWSITCLGCFIPRKRAASTHWIGGWVGSRASLDAVAKKKNSCLLETEP